MGDIKVLEECPKGYYSSEQHEHETEASSRVGEKSELASKIAGQCQELDPTDETGQSG